MKKIFFALFFLMSLAPSAYSQEIIAIGGYGYNEADSVNKGDYNFIETRIMFDLLPQLRGGFYGSTVGYGNLKTNISELQGREWKYGISLDSWGILSYSHSYYAWFNSGLKNVTDRYKESFYKSKTLTNELFLEGGLSITDDWQGWFGHHQFMVNYHKPIGAPKITATWKDIPVTSAPYNKESFRLTWEAGIKRIGKTLEVEPLLKAGYGHDFGREKSYYELGGGLGFGIYKDWYREIFKVTVFKRNDFKGEFENINSTTPGGRTCVEFTFNASSLYQLIVHK